MKTIFKITNCLLLLTSFWMYLLSPIAYAQTFGDSLLNLSEGSYALGAQTGGTDLDYTKSFSGEAIAIIRPHATGGKHASFIQKGNERVIWSNTSKGFGLGIYYNSLTRFGKQIMANIADGSNSVHVTSSSYYEGYVYAVMTWNAATQTMTLYVNGQNVGQDSNTLDPVGIVNTYGIQLGRGQGDLNKDMFMARLWNRELTQTEITNLWNSYDQTGRHTLPSGFSTSNLVSEWLMQGTSDSGGNPGTTHIKDTQGNNHLELLGGASIIKGSGSLQIQYPASGATGIDKAVTLRVSGGLGDISSAVKPLQYYFQIDETASFDTPNLKESGWVKHYGQWSPLLKPETTYHWRVKVKDSSGTFTETAYTPNSSFTTEGPTNWYLRDPLGTYGNGDGTSFDNAWNSLLDIEWGEGGVEAGDNLYICGKQIIHDVTARYFGDMYTEYVEASGLSEQYPITIRMDCPNGPGEFWSAFEDNYGGPPQWNGPDANGVYWTSDFTVGTPAIERQGNNYIVLKRSGSTTWIDGLGQIHNENGTTYVKTTDGSHPQGKIYSRGGYNILDLGRSSHIKFYKCNFYWSTQPKEKQATTKTTTPAAHHITYDSCELRYGNNLIDLYAGHDFWTVRNSKLHDAGNGIYTHTPGNMYSLVVENNEIYDIGTSEFYHKDAHGVGVQNGIDFIIQNNTFRNTGEAICFWSGNYEMKNNTIRYNFIKDVYDKNVTNGGGIVISGNTATEKRHSYFIYGNIILNPALNTYEDFQGGGITVNIGGNANLHIHNNIIYNEGGSHTNGRGAIRVYNSQNFPLQNVHIYNNIIYNPNYRYIYLSGSGDPWQDVNLDHNIYYPAPSGSPELLYTSKPITHDANSIHADPLFISSDPQTAADFMLQESSPARDTGFNVGLTKDIAGNPVYQGTAPDIGAFEYLVNVPFMYGDVSEDQIISAVDAALAARYSTGKITLNHAQITKGDVTGDGLVTAPDASWILRKAFDPTIVFPVENP